MQRLILAVMLCCAVLGAEAADERGAEDPLRNAGMSRPFTVFDQLLASLDRRASEIAERLRPEKNDFQPSITIPFIAISQVHYDRSSARIGIEFGLDVSGMADPWRDVCAKRVKDIVGPRGLSLPSTRGKIWQPSAFLFFSPLLGARLVASDQLENYKAFSDSIVIKLRFNVEGSDRTKPLKFLRECFWDNKTGDISFREHEY